MTVIALISAGLALAYSAYLHGAMIQLAEIIRDMAAQTQSGRTTFELRYAFSGVDVAGDYWHLWPGRRAWEAGQ